MKMSKRLSVLTVCNNEINKHKYEKLDWGFQFRVDTEIEALRLAYSYRNAPYGVEVKFAEPVNQYLVTVFNEVAVQTGIVKAK
jgi:hypothetical protein